MQPVVFKEWITQATKFALTLDDALKLDEPLHVIFIDRNFLDVLPTDVDVVNVAELAQRGIFYSGMFVKNGNSKNCLEATVTWDNTTLQTTKNFELHVLLDDRFWWPLRDGRVVLDEYLPVTIYQAYNGLHFHKLPPSTLVGWRGKMLAVDKLWVLPPLIIERDD